MEKKYNSIKDVIKNFESDNDFKKKSIKYIEEHSLSKFLSLLRCKANLTQKQLSKKIKCSQSRISKIESLSDNLISVKDLTDYGNALNKCLVIGFESKDVTIVAIIKHHVLRMQTLLNRLVKLADGDAEIDKGISQFFVDTLTNLFNMFEQSARKLKNIKITKSIKKNIIIEETDEILKKNTNHLSRNTYIQ